MNGISVSVSLSLSLTHTPTPTHPHTHVQVSDFGLSQIKKVKAEGRKSGVKTSTDGEDEEGEEDGGVGSLLWAAPEVLAGGRGDEKADVYAYGVMLWELLHWSEPFPGVAALKVRRIVYNIQCSEIFTLRMEKLHTEAGHLHTELQCYSPPSRWPWRCRTGNGRSLRRMRRRRCRGLGS